MRILKAAALFALLGFSGISTADPPLDGVETGDGPSFDNQCGPAPDFDCGMYLRCNRDNNTCEAH